MLKIHYITKMTKWTKDKTDEIYNLRKEGLSLQEIGEKFGTTKQNISRVVSNMKLSGYDFEGISKKNPRWNNEKKLRIQELRLKGVSYIDIAKEFSISIDVLSSVIYRMNKEGYDVLTSDTWSTSEVNQLIKLRKEGNNNKIIAEILGKKYDSVKHKASELVKEKLIERITPSGNPINEFSREELIKAIKTYITAEACPGQLRYGVNKTFGSWTKGLEAAGIPGNIGGVFQKDRPTTIYFLDFGDFQKIGITQQQIKSRFSGAPPYTVIDQCVTELENAVYLERALKKVVKQYIPDHPWFERNGKTECFKSRCKTLEELFSAEL